MLYLFVFFLMNFGSQFLFFVDHSFYTIIHILHEIDFRTTESPLVRDVINVVISLCVLSVGTSDLDVVLVGDGLEFVLLVSELGELDVD
jgi:hypothetical protein